MGDKGSLQREKIGCLTRISLVPGKRGREPGEAIMGSLLQSMAMRLGHKLWRRGGRVRI